MNNIKITKIFVLLLTVFYINLNIVVSVYAQGKVTPPPIIPTGSGVTEAENELKAATEAYQNAFKKLEEANKLKGSFEGDAQGQAKKDEAMSTYREASEKLAAAQNELNKKQLFIPHNIGSDTNNKNYLENQLLPGIARLIIGITGGLSLVFVIVGGLQLLTAYGNADAAGKAKKTIMLALVGILIASLSYAIVAIIASINV